MDVTSPVTRVYWGCTTGQCRVGFGGTEEDLPREWTYCPWCGGLLVEISERKYERRERLWT